MRDIAWRFGFSFIALVSVAILGSSLSCGVSNRFVERLSGQTPQAQIERFVAAIVDGDRQAAMALWLPPGTPDGDLETRRELVLDSLLLYGPRIEHRIIDVEWWRTCCEPGVIDDPREAGGAHVRVAIGGPDQPEAVYIFDVLVPGGYWGSAMGNPVRHWTIVDVYPEVEAPLTWPWVNYR